MRENHVVELKSSWRDEHLKWISGFANSQGGKLVIGRSDDGKVVGVPDVDRLLVDIPNKVVNILGIVVDVNRKGRAGKEYLEIVVKPHFNPVSYKGEYHVRSGSTNQDLKGAALDRFLLRKQGLRWDGVPVPHVTMRSLDGKSIQTFRTEARYSQRLLPEVLRMPRAELLDKLHLTEGHGSRVLLKRAAVLLFHPEPERHVAGAFVKVGFFRSESELLYHDEVRGSLFTQVNATMDLLRTKYLRALVSFRGIQRVETYPVPDEALREALINAAAHKDYSATAPIQIRVYEDRIRISNSAVLPDGWTAATLLGPHSSHPPNPAIANVLFRAGMIESWGGGIAMMRRECAAQGSPEPELHYDAQTVRLEFPFAPPTTVVAGTRVETPGQTPGQTPVETRVETRVETLVKAPGRTPERILALLAEHPSMTMAEMAAQVGKSDSAVERAIAKLMAAGRLRRVGSRKSGHWEVLE